MSPSHGRLPHLRRAFRSRSILPLPKTPITLWRLAIVRSIAAAGLVVPFLITPVSARAQASGDGPAASPIPTEFDVADVHVSPHVLRPFMDGGNLNGDRYTLHQATMTDMIAAAYHLDSANAR